MRVLNDGEIPSDFLLDGATPRESYKMGNKAQFSQDIKDFTEWGEVICIEHHGSYSFIRRRQCEKCWESLKQLVEG